MVAPSIPNTLVNATPNDAGPVNENFTALLNGIIDGTKDLTISALVLNSTLTFAGDLLPSAASARSIGSTTVPLKAIFMDNGATDGGTIYFNSGTTALLKSSADGATASLNGFTTLISTTAKNLCHGWVTFEVDVGVTIFDSFNVDSVVYNGSGSSTITWTTDFSDGDYFVTGFAAAAFVVASTFPLAGSVTILTYLATNQQLIAPGWAGVIAFGARS